MKYGVAAAIVVTVAIIASAMVLNSRQPPEAIRIELSSDPFPLAVGPTTLLVRLTDANGEAVERATVTVTGQMTHAGMLPLTRDARREAGGVYEVPFTWPMAGQWAVDVAVQLPARGVTAEERFLLYVYGMRTASSGTQTVYRSQSDYEAAREARPDNELWIVIPQGAQAMIRAGQEDEIIPPEIRLNVRGRNVLVIQNDDIADHTIGPFFIRSGETVRQTFTAPAVYQGTCSIRYNAEVNIVVEG